MERFRQLGVSVLMRLLCAAAVCAAVYGNLGVRVTVPTMDGVRYYRLYRSDRGQKYRDTLLFANIFGGMLSDVMRYVMIRAQMETDGVFDGDRTVDVSAYVNRNSAALPNDYITAQYRLSDLLQWAQSGFTYETRRFDMLESASFLSESTKVTHILSDSAGSPYLNTLVEGNTAVTSEPSHAMPAGGSYRILRNRYPAADGKGPEQVVSDWGEYGMLTANIENAAAGLLRDYELYNKGNAYFDGAETNLRYYFVRTVGERTEVYTNGAYSAEEAPAAFRSMGSYLIYAPMDDVVETNTRLDREAVLSVLAPFRYGIPKVAVLLVGVELPCTAEDAFFAGQEKFAGKPPAPAAFYALSAGLALMWCALYVLRIRKSVQEAGRHIPSPEDKKGLPVEAYVLPLLAAPVAGLAGIRILTGTTDGGAGVIALCGLIAAFADLLFSFGVFGLMEKWGRHTLRRDSLLRGALRGAANAVRAVWHFRGAFFGAVLPFALLLFLHFVLPARYGDGARLPLLLMDVAALAAAGFLATGRARILEGIRRIRSGETDYKLPERFQTGTNLALLREVNSLGDGIEQAAVVRMRDEKMKSDLITNVSHDIKTPLTSIINYVGLLKREKIEDPKIAGYIAVLDEKSQRLKTLTIDLVEASRITSGNIEVVPTTLNLTELVRQMLGEFDERLRDQRLQVVFDAKDRIDIRTDIRHLSRVMENLFDNLCKYAMPDTRVYIDLARAEGWAVLSVKNISGAELNFDADELTERFIRGDLSRTEGGTGLGLPIVKSLMGALSGTFDLTLDGDLFKVTLRFPLAEEGNK